MIFLAPFLDRLTDKIGGKYVLIRGLALFAAGMGLGRADSDSASGLAGLPGAPIVASLDMGGTFAPLTTVAMREVGRMAEAASGMLNTVRQVGSVIGTAAGGTPEFWPRSKRS